MADLLLAFPVLAIVLFRIRMWLTLHVLLDFSRSVMAEVQTTICAKNEVQPMTSECQQSTDSQIGRYLWFCVASRMSGEFSSRFSDSTPSRPDFGGARLAVDPVAGRPLLSLTLTTQHQSANY